MNYRILCVGLIAAAAATASAQTRTTMTGKCDKPSSQQSLPAGDQEGHAFMVAQGSCTVVGSVNGAVARKAMFTEEVDATPASIKNRGVFVVTFDSGDKVYYRYQGSATMKDGAYQSGTNKYEIAGGTGKLQGVNGSGSCKLAGGSDSSVDYSCTGEYHMGMPTGNNSRGQGRGTPVQR